MLPLHRRREHRRRRRTTTRRRPAVDTAASRRPRTTGCRAGIETPGAKPPTPSLPRRRRPRRSRQGAPGPRGSWSRSWRSQMSVLVRPDCKITRVVGRPPDSEAHKSDYLRTRHHEGEPRVINTARPENLPIHLRVTLKLALRVTPFETRALTAGRPPPDRYALFKVFAQEFAAEWSRLQAEAGAHLSRARSERERIAGRSIGLSTHWPTGSRQSA